MDRDDREIPTEVGEEFSQRHGMYFLETSAKGSENVEKLFNEIATELLQVPKLLLCVSFGDWPMPIVSLMQVGTDDGFRTVRALV